MADHSHWCEASGERPCQLSAARQSCWPILTTRQWWRRLRYRQSEIGAVTSSPSNRRKCILFINEQTLFVCLAIGVVKSDYRRIVPFFLDLLGRTLRQEGFSEEETAWVLDQHGRMTVDRTHDRSVLGSLNNRITDAKCIIEYKGGLDHCDVSTLVHLLNDTPMKPIGYSKGLEQMKQLVDKCLLLRDDPHYHTIDFCRSRKARTQPAISEMSFATSLELGAERFRPVDGS